MAAKSSFLPRLSLSRPNNNSILPLRNNPRYPLRTEPSEYNLDELSPRDDDGLLWPDFHDPNSPGSPPTTKPSDLKPTGLLNRRPSNSSDGSASKTRKHVHGDTVMFAGPPPPIAMSRVLYRDEEGRFDDDDERSDKGGTASWLPGTARKAISSVIWDRTDNSTSRNRDDKPVVYDRNSAWRSLQRRERAIVHDVQQFLQIQEESLTGSRSADYDGRNSGRSSGGTSDGGSATPTGAGTGTYSMTSTASTRRLGRSIIEPVARSGPSGEIIPVRQPRQKKIGIGGARKGIARSIGALANLKAEEDASILSALSVRKQALARLRKLATRREGIVEELHSLETDEEEPLARELEDLGNEHRGVCSEIEELEERLAGLKSRRRYLEGRMDDARNRREAGLSGYKNALREVEGAVKGFLTRPPVKPLDVEAFAENTDGEGANPSPGGVEFMHLRPERRTIDMAREWWESEVAILEKRKVQVDTDRAALEEGSDIWQEVVSLVLDFEAALRQQVLGKGNAVTSDGKGKERELTADETLRLQYEKINSVILGLEQRLHVAEENGWNLLIAAIGAELEAFSEAARMNREMLEATGIAVDESLLVAPMARDLSREDSGTTESHNSFHTVDGSMMKTMEIKEQLLDLPNNHENKEAESDNEVPPDLLATHEEHDGDRDSDEEREKDVATGIPVMDREDSENEVPPELLIEHENEH